MTRDPEKTTPFVKEDPKPASGGKASHKSSRGAPHREPGEKVARTVGPMFGNFEAAKKRKLPKWAAPLLGSMLLFHVVLFVTMWVKTIWDIEQLDRPKDSSDLAIAAPPPPPPPPPKGGVKPKDVTITPKKIKVHDLVQPVKIEKQEVVQQVSSGDDNGVEGGVDNGVAEAPPPIAVAPPPPPPPPPPAPPPTVAPATADANRISGEKNIVPDDVTKTEISRSGKEKLVGSFKLFITIDGNIGQVVQLKSTGFPAYDSKILNTIKSDWRYNPFTVNGKPTAVWTAVTFIYSQK